MRYGFGMNEPPADLFLRFGDYPDPEARMCWIVGRTRVSWIDNETRVQEKDILVVRTKPHIFPNGLVGLASRSTLFGVDDFVRRELSGAVIWEVDTAGGQYVARQSLGLAVVCSPEGERNFQKHHFQQE